MLTETLKDEIKKYAHSSPNEEICGFILQSGESIFIHPCKNISSNKEHHWTINPLDYLRAWENGKNQIIGLFHSQRNTPSSLDYFIAQGHSIYSVVYSISEDKFFEIKEEHYKWKEYLGKYFEIGKMDCLTLVQKFYKKEYNIDINDYHREDNWFKLTPTLIGDSHIKEGFIEIKKGEALNEGDILAFSHGHLGIYIPESLLLHHPRRKNSLIEQLNDVYRRALTNIYRHKSKI